MEKKIDKRFYLLSAINILPAVILGGGLTLDSLILVAALGALVLNHTILVKIVESLTDSARGVSDGAGHSAGRILMLMGLKFMMLFLIIALIYYYKKELITKLFLIIFFQLIIQVVSIKNNYKK